MAEPTKNIRLQLADVAQRLNEFNLKGIMKLDKAQKFALVFGALWFVGVATFWILVLVGLFKLVMKYL